MKKRHLPNIGFEYTLDNRILIIQIIAMLKENISLTNEQIEKFIIATSNYLDKTGKRENLFELYEKIDFINEQVDEYDKPFYKFINKETLNHFVKKGKFQLGSLSYYREIENNESRDEKEGFSNLIINSGDRQILTSVISGFDHYIFCGTFNLDLKEKMSGKFGDYVLKIQNVKSFAEKIKKAIGAKQWGIDKIKYSDFKAFKTDCLINDLNAAVSPDLSEEFFNILHKISLRPSIFSKPNKFQDEQELRLIFKMDKKVKEKLNFDNLGLLNDIEIIKTTANK